MKIRFPWSVAFLRRMSPFVTLASALRLRKMVLREAGKRRPQPGLVPIRVRKPFRADVWLREPGTDFSTFREVVLNTIYSTVVNRTMSCEYVLDVGANIGLTSLYLASCFPSCRILSVEPAPENRKILAKNLGPLLEAGRCQICPGAVWGQDSTVDLNPTPRESEYDAITVSAAKSTGMRNPVPAYSIESLMRIAGFPRVDILKLDVEGAEAEVFRGPTAWLARVNAIAIEFHGESRRTSRFDAVVGQAGFVIEEDRFPNTVVAFRPTNQWVR